MTRGAEQAARCPWCSCAVHREAPECPECLFPLTMAGVEGGGRPSAEPRGTTSTASPLPTPSRRFQVPRHVQASSPRSHRLRLISWLLGLTAALLLVAGIASWISVSSPGTRADGVTQRNLVAAVSRARGDAGSPQVTIEELPGHVASSAPERVSVTSIDGRWFGAARSTSGRCYVLAWRLDGARELLGGTLAKAEACTGDSARARLSTLLDRAGPKAR